MTEREYCRDLRLTCEVFKLNDPQYLEMKGVDVATLFGNILEVYFYFILTKLLKKYVILYFLKVIALSEAFIDELNRCNVNTEESNSTNQSIGKSFIQTEPEFRRVYSLYCINHDNAQFLLEKVIVVVAFNATSYLNNLPLNLFFYCSTKLCPAYIKCWMKGSPLFETK